MTASDDLAWKIQLESKFLMQLTQDEQVARYKPVRKAEKNRRKELINQIEAFPRLTSIRVELRHVLRQEGN